MNERRPSDLADRIVVRLPDGMRDRLAIVAKANGRSSNSEVVAALEAWLNRGKDFTFLSASDEQIEDVARRLAAAIKRQETVAPDDST